MPCGLRGRNAKQADLGGGVEAKAKQEANWVHVP